MALSIITFFEQIFQFFVNGLFGLLNGLTTFIFNLIGGGFQGVFSNFAASLETYGIWSIPLLVLVLGIAGLGVYGILTMSEIANELV